MIYQEALNSLAVNINAACRNLKVTEQKALVKALLHESVRWLLSITYVYC